MSDEQTSLDDGGYHACKGQDKEYLASVNMNKKEITILSMNQPNLETYKQMIIKLGYTPR